MHSPRLFYIGLTQHKEELKDFQAGLSTGIRLGFLPVFYGPQSSEPGSELSVPDWKLSVPHPGLYEFHLVLLWIRIRSDPELFALAEPDPECITVLDLIRIRNKMDDKSSHRKSVKLPW